MKIAIDIRSLTSPTPSGVGHYVLEVLTAMTREDHPEFLLFSTGMSKPKLPQVIIDDPKITLVHLRAPNKIVNLGIVLGLVTLDQILDDKVDAVWFPNTGFLPATNARTILTVHDLAFHLMPDTYTKLDHLRYRITRTRSSIKTADHIIAISNSTKTDVMTGFNRSQNDISVIYHGVSSSFTPEYKPSDDNVRQKYSITKPYILSLATLEPRKNIASLVEAFTALRERGHNIQLVLAGGNGWLKTDLDKAIARSPYNNDIKLLGFVDDNERPALLRGAQILALVSRYEGFGMQLLEAMACGTPIVTARNSSLGEIAGDAAVYVRAMDVSEISTTLNALLQDNELRLQLRARGLTRTQEYNWKNSAQKTLNLIHYSISINCLH